MNKKHTISAWGEQFRFGSGSSQNRKVKLAFDLEARKRERSDYGMAFIIEPESKYLSRSDPMQVVNAFHAFEISITRTPCQIPKADRHVFGLTRIKILRGKVYTVIVVDLSSLINGIELFKFLPPERSSGGSEPKQLKVFLARFTWRGGGGNEIPPSICQFFTCFS